MIPPLIPLPELKYTPEVKIDMMELIETNKFINKEFIRAMDKIEEIIQKDSETPWSEKVTVSTIKLKEESSLEKQIYESLPEKQIQELIPEKKIHELSPEKPFHAYLLYVKSEVLAEALKVEFSSEKGKPIGNRQGKEIYKSLCTFFDRDIGTYQGVFGYTINQKTDQSDR